MTRHAYPDNDILDRAIRKKGLSWVARELGIAHQTLRNHCVRQGLATRQDSVALEVPDALQKVAALL